MTDFAKLVLVADSRQMVEASRAIDQVGMSADRAETRVNGAAVGMAKAMTQVGNASKMAAMQQRNLVFQLNDVAVSLASGMNPMMVAAQQGSQIATIWGPEEGGVGRAFRETGKMLGGVIGRFPGLSIGAAAAALAIGGMTYEINQATDVAVGFGHVISAVFTTLGDRIMDAVKPAVDFISPYVGAAWDWIVEKTKWLGNSTIGVFVGAKDGIVAAWSLIPGAIGSMVYSGANAVIGGVEVMINATIGLVNSFVLSIENVMNMLPDFAKPGGGLSLGRIDSVSISRLANPYAGQGAAAGKAFSKAFGAAMENDYLGNFYDDVKKAAIGNALEDIKKKGKKAGKDTEDAFERAAKAIRESTDELNLNTAFASAPADVMTQFRKEQELVNAALEAGRKLTPSLTAQIAELAKSYVSAETAAAAAKKAQEALAEGARFARDLSGGFFSDMKSGLQSGKSLWESFADAALNALNKIMDKIMEVSLDALFSGGTGGNFFSSLFGMFGGGGLAPAGSFGAFIGLPSFAGGGFTGGGSRSGGIDGRGGSLAIVHPNETVVDHERGQRLGASQSVVVNQTYQLSGAISSADLVAALKANNEQNKREIEGMFAGNYARNRKAGMI